MYHKKLQDSVKRNSFNLKESEILLLKVLLRDNRLDKDIREMLSLKLSALGKKASNVKIKNRCVLTYRSHSVHRFFKLSRIKVRELITAGDIRGSKKASW